MLSRQKFGISNFAKATALVGMAPGSNATTDLKPVRAEIGKELQTHLSRVLRDPVPDSMVELLKQLDQPTEKRPER
jgi:hypothetical protein